MILPEDQQIKVQVIDSHTGGEPTRTVLAGGPHLRGGTVAEQRTVFEREQGAFRRAVVTEPRGHDGLVGALLVPPQDPRCTVGVIFFNNVGCLGMCGHGTMGVVMTLAHLGRIQPGALKLETPAGVVQAVWEGGAAVALTNVPAYVKALNVTVTIPGLGLMTGDVAWGGNWFFLVADHGLAVKIENLPQLTDLATRLKLAVHAAGYPEVDHMELLGPSDTGADGRSFVLCPGGAYDRSPCGTGTSAKLACLAARGQLEPGMPWVQESIIGSRFTAAYTWHDRSQGIILPTLQGTAFVTAAATLSMNPADPFYHGIPPH